MYTAGALSVKDGDFSYNRTPLFDRDGQLMGVHDKVVLYDPDDLRSTMSIALPGRGPLQRAKGIVGRNKYEATDASLNELRISRTPVFVTLRCQGDGTPIARSLSYRNEDGSSESISY